MIPPDFEVEYACMVRIEVYDLKTRQTLYRNADELVLVPPSWTLYSKQERNIYMQFLADVWMYRTFTNLVQTSPDIFSEELLTAYRKNQWGMKAEIVGVHAPKELKAMRESGQNPPICKWSPDFLKNSLGDIN